MTTLTAPSPSPVTFADLLDRLGGVPAHRIRLQPAPGTATEADVIALEARENRLFELVDGVLVEKGMGYLESLLAVAIASALREYVVPRKLGFVTGADGMMRLFPGLVRIPDVAFVSRGRLPGGHVPRQPIPPVAPDLAVEVLSESNTVAEMSRKRREYFEAGVRILWEVDPKPRTVTVYVSADQPSVLHENDVLDGGDVLPGFTLPPGPLFAELDE